MAQAARALQQQRLEAPVVFGIYAADGELLRKIQRKGKSYELTDSPVAVKVPVALEKFITVPKRFKIAFGGRSGAKSYTFGDILSSLAKDEGDKTLCIREMQNSIEDSVHALLKSGIERLRFENFEITDKAIRLHGEDVFKFKGMGRNADAVKSMFGFKRAWCEEAQGLSFKSLELLTPTIRMADSELWFSLNPQSSADPISQRFLKPFYKDLLTKGFYEDDLHLIVWINYDQNPWHGAELEQERIYDLENMSKAGYNHKWLGHYDDEVDDAIIPVEHFDAAIDAHIKLGFKGEGAVIASHDPSDLGNDDKGYALRHGSVFLDVSGRSSGDVNAGMDWAIGKAVTDNADMFVWDADGLGISLKRQVDEALKGKKMDYFMFRGSQSPENPDEIYVPDENNEFENRKTNKESFYNKRAQYYIRLADRFKKTFFAVEKGEYINPDELISLSSEISDIDQLRAELCRIPTKPNNNGKIQLMTKVEMARPPLSLPSPNLADAMMMAMHSPQSRSKLRKLRFRKWA